MRILIGRLLGKVSSAKAISYLKGVQEHYRLKASEAHRAHNLKFETYNELSIRAFREKELIAKKILKKGLANP